MQCWVEVEVDKMPSEDEVDGGSNAAAKNQYTITESNLATTKPIGVKAKEEQSPNGKSTTEDSNIAVAETIATESNTLLDSVVISAPFEETDVLVESIYITETEDKTDDIETIDLVTPDSTAALEVAVTSDTEVSVTPDTEVAVILDTEVAETPNTEVAVTLDTEIAVNLDTEIAVTPDTETVLTPDTEKAVTPETEANVTLDTEVAVNPDTPEITEHTIVKSDHLELLTLPKSVGESQLMSLETEAELVGMEDSDADAEIDTQDSFMETKDEIVDDLVFIRGKLATPPILMEDVMKEQEVTGDATNSHGNFNPGIDTGTYKINEMGQPRRFPS